MHVFAENGSAAPLDNIFHHPVISIVASRHLELAFLQVVVVVDHDLGLPGVVAALVSVFVIDSLESIVDLVGITKESVTSENEKTWEGGLLSLSGHKRC